MCQFVMQKAKWRVRLSHKSAVGQRLPNCQEAEVEGASAAADDWLQLIAASSRSLRALDLVLFGAASRGLAAVLHGCPALAALSLTMYSGEPARGGCAAAAAEHLHATPAALPALRLLELHFESAPHSAFAAQATNLVRRCARLETLAFAAREPDLLVPVDLPAALRSLRVCAFAANLPWRVEPRGPRSLPCLPALRSVELTRAAFAGSALAYLPAACPALERLVLDRCRLGLVHRFAAPFRRLSVLQLLRLEDFTVATWLAIVDALSPVGGGGNRSNSNGNGGGTASGIAASPLRNLRLCALQLSAARGFNWAVMSQLTRLAGLRALTVDRLELATAEMAALLRGLPALEQLALGVTAHEVDAVQPFEAVTDEVVGELQGSELRELSLCGTEVTGAALALLPPTLAVLHICCGGQPPARRFCIPPSGARLPALRTVSLRCPWLHDDDAARLVLAAPHLRRLTVQCSGLTAAALLFAVAALPVLEDLCLSVPRAPDSPSDRFVGGVLLEGLGAFMSFDSIRQLLDRYLAATERAGGGGGSDGDGMFAASLDSSADLLGMVFEEVDLQRVRGYLRQLRRSGRSEAAADDTLDIQLRHIVG